MKAIQYNNFGNSTVIALNELPQPEIKNPTDVLIQVKAASVNPLDILEEAAQAQDYVSAGGVNGKVVLKLN